MMTIDDMLSQVAKIKGVAPETVKSEAPKPIGAVKGETSGGKIGERVLRFRPSLGLSFAKEIACCIERAAEAIGLNAVIAVTDESGRLILLEAMDDSYIASLAAAQEKAYTAVALKMPTHEALKESRGGSLDGYTSGGEILLLAGGYPVRYDNAVIGGIGVSGGTKDQDMMLAYTGVKYFEERIKSLKF